LEEMKKNPFNSKTTSLESRIQYDNDRPNHGNLSDRKCNSIRKNLVWAVALGTHSFSLLALSFLLGIPVGAARG